MPNYRKTQRDTLPRVSTYRHGETIGYGEPVALVGTQTDAFGKVRISDSKAYISIAQVCDELDYIVDTELSGGGSATYDKSRSSTILAVSGADSFAIKQTYEHAIYIPGNSMIVDMSISQFENETNCVKRVGSFSSAYNTPFSGGFDGLFFESSNDGYSFNVYNSGTLVEKVEQADWNVDRLDGTGLTRLSMSFDKNQILAYDFQWLGIGRVRWGFVVNGNFIQAHDSNFSNNENHTGVYMRTANKPLRWECRQEGVGTGSFEMICASFRTEGTDAASTKDISVNSGTTEMTLATGGTKYLVYAIRAKEGEEEAAIDGTKLSFFSSTNDNFLWEVIVNPVFTGSLSWNPVDYTHCEYAIGNGSITLSGGTKVSSGYFAGKVDVETELSQYAARFGTAIDGTRDIIAVCATTFGTNAKLVHASTTKIYI